MYLAGSLLDFERQGRAPTELTRHPLMFTQDDAGLQIALPPAAIGEHAFAFRISGLQPAKQPPMRFAFGRGPAPAGYTQVLPTTKYSSETGYGFESVIDRPVFFSVAVPEGSYRVTVTLVSTEAAGDTTIFAELRRLMLEHIVTKPGARETRSFIVNVRRPEIPGGGTVTLKDREKTLEAWAWDHARSHLCPTWNGEAR